MQRTYELMFIVRPDMTEEDQDKLIGNLEGQVGTAGGTVKSVERMGKRRLAYMVRRFQDGIYVLMVLEGDGASMRANERIHEFYLGMTSVGRRNYRSARAERMARLQNG